MAKSKENQTLIGVKVTGGEYAEGGSHIAGKVDPKAFYSAETFPGCTHPPVHLITLDLNNLKCLPKKVQKMGKLPVFYTNCEPCDAWMLDGGDYESEMHFKIEKSGQAHPLHPDDYRNVCKKSSSITPPAESFGVTFAPYDPDAPNVWHAVYVGGEPEWVQSKDGWAFCAECEDAMEFVARVRAVRFGCGDQDLYVFVCPDCRTMALKMQFT